MFPLDRSSDGRWVLVGRELQPERELALISTEDGSVRSLKTFEDPSPGGFPRQASLSPDGRFLAYDYLKDGESTDYDIHVLDVEPQQLAPPLINQFIELRQRNIL